MSAPWAGSSTSNRSSSRATTHAQPLHRPSSARASRSAPADALPHSRPSPRGAGAAAASRLPPPGDDVEDAEFVRRELDTFEVQKSRQLATTLERPANARELSAASATDRDAHHAQMKELLKLTGGRRPGSKANDIVRFDKGVFQKYPEPLDTGSAPLMTWLHDLRNLRVHDFLLGLRAAGCTGPAILEPWFRHSKRNASATMTNAHTSLRNLLAELLRCDASLLSLADCQTFYDRLTDKKHGTMDLAPAAAKLDVLLSDVSDATWERFVDLFLSGALHFMAPGDFIAPFDLYAVLSTMDAIAHEQEAVEILRGSCYHRHVSSGDTSSAASVANLSEPPVAYTRYLRTLRADVDVFALRAPRGKMLTRDEALGLFAPNAAFIKAARSGVYEESIVSAAAAAEQMSRQRKEEERRQLLSQMTRMRLPTDEIRKVQAGAA